MASKNLTEFDGWRSVPATGMGHNFLTGHRYTRHLIARFLEDPERARSEMKDALKLAAMDELAGHCGWKGDESKSGAAVAFLGDVVAFFEYTAKHGDFDKYLRPYEAEAAQMGHRMDEYQAERAEKDKATKQAAQRTAKRAIGRAMKQAKQS